MRYLSIIIVALVALAGQASTNSRVRLQRMLPIETLDTVLVEGEIVVVEDEAGTGIPSLRIGDGSTPGGQIAESAYAARAGRRRLLRRAEYHIAITGATTYSNGVYTLLRSRTGISSLDPTNVGSIEITPVAGGLLSGVTYDMSAMNATVADTAQDGDLAWESIVISGAESSGITLQPGGGDLACAISNIAVYAWTGLHLIGHTNDLRGSVLMVGPPTSADDAISRDYFESRLDGRWGNDWWRHIAGGPMRLDGQPVWVAPTIRQVGREDGLDWIMQTPAGTDRPIMTSTLSSGSTSNQIFTILDSNLVGTNVQIWITASIDFATVPTIQHRASMLTGSWTNLPTSTAWPSTVTITVAGERRRAWSLSAVRPAGSSSFFRVAGQTSDSQVVSDYIEFQIGDLRNKGTITAGSGYRVASPPSSTNYVAGATANVVIGDVTLVFMGGLFIRAE